MFSAVIDLPTDRPVSEALAGLADGVGGLPDAATPDLVLAFLPPGDTLAPTLAALAERWPEAQRLGCEAVTQFAGGGLTASGTLQLLRFADPRNGAEVEVIEAAEDQPPPPERLSELADHLAAADAALLLVDGVRFPIQPVLAHLRCERDQRGDGAWPPLAGGLASQPAPTVGAAGARVFHGDRVYPSALLAVTFRGIAMRIEVVRGWDPASPAFSVTRAEGNVLYEIDGEPATAWYRKFFSVDGQLAPMPESGLYFPLIVEGPDADRRGLYRSMRAFDQPPGAVTFWGDLATGDRVRLGMGNDVSLVRTAAALPQAAPRPEAAMLFSCVGREQVLGERAASEVATIHRALGGAALAGFFSHAEIGPGTGGGPAFYNQTAVLALLHEVAA